MKKEFLQGYRTFIFFVVLTIFQIVFMLKDIEVGKATLTTWVLGCTVWLGANKTTQFISVKKDRGDYNEQ